MLSNSSFTELPTTLRPVLGENPLHLTSLSLILLEGEALPPNPPAPGDGLYRSSAARIQNGKQPLGPGTVGRKEEREGFSEEGLGVLQSLASLPLRIFCLPGEA